MREMEDCQNIEKLNQDALDLIAWAFENHFVGWTNCCAIEVRLDDPVQNILDGGDGFVAHGGSDSRCYIKHYDDPEWAIVHHNDPSWKKLPLEEMSKRAADNMQRIHADTPPQTGSKDGD